MLELSLKLREEFCSDCSAQLIDDVLGNLSGHGIVSGVHNGSVHAKCPNVTGEGVKSSVLRLTEVLSTE